MSNIKIRKFYLRDIKHQVGASPVWPVSVSYNLGDYGYYSRKTGHFAVRGNIFDDLGVPREGVIVPPSDPPTLLYKVFNSSNTTQNDFIADVDADPQTAKLSLGFGSEKSYFFHMYRAQVSYLKLNDLVRDKLKEARENDKWRYRYRMVEMVYTVPDVRFVFSLSSNASLNLSGNVDLGQKVAKGTIDYGMKSSSNVDGSFWIEDAPSTPFVHFASFKRRELKFHDEKRLGTAEWHLEADSTSSFEDEIDLDVV